MKTQISSTPRYSTLAPWIWPIVLLFWCVLLCWVPDPRPLGAPEWAVDAMHRLLGLSDPKARAVATLVLRASGLALIGVFLSLCLRHFSLRIASTMVLVLAPLLAILCQWVNYGYFPIFIQLQLGIVSAVVGALLGLAIRRHWLPAGVLAVLLSGLYFWGTSTGISDDLAEDARATGQYLLANAETIPAGDAGFAKILELAFQFAEDNSHSTDAVHPNQAAILALGVILGEETVAKVAGRQIDIDRLGEFAVLRNRVELMGRHDLARHFWVSAALVVLSDENRSMAVGIGKELMDATEGGSGFSFVDLTADRAGTRFAVAATKNGPNARNLQSRIRQGVVIADFFPSIEGLPEGLTRDVFQNEYGGLGGKETQKLANEIARRIDACAALQTID